MAKQKKKTEEEKTEEPIIEETSTQTQELETYNLVELVSACPESDMWVIYNLARKGLLAQYEYELEHYGMKELPTTLTIKDFDEIVNGKQ